ncbi:MAG: pilus (MSHA type) biogenesis protein MshL [Rhodocyclaceae bacterium]|nr:MAG: pilus (MSHA type) biogenesis protein MshL [Rhodocyclaceae bacterium]
MHRPIFRVIAASLSALIVTGCASTGIKSPANGHLTTESAPPTDNAGIPTPVQSALTLPKPKTASKTETYSVVVNNIKAQELLFALARDAKLNIDIHPGINGTVTLNAIDQTLQQLLTRISKQVDMRWELDGPNLSVMPDTPFLRTYRVDYVNMTRDTSGTVTVTTQIASAGAGATTGGASGGASGGGNNSLTKIENKAQNHFWETLEKNIKDILRETDKILPEGSSETVIERSDQQSAVGAQPTAGNGSGRGGQNPAPVNGVIQQEGSTVVKRTTFREAASVIVNAESGIVNVRATSRQHEKIQEFIDNVMNAARRQVLIEATIAEVQLSDNYQQGINWAALALGRAGFQIKQNPTGNLAAPASSLLELTYTNNDSRFGNISGTVKLLESFGTVRVLSSPKLSVLNNQTAVLKVVDNSVYFTIKADTTTNQTTSTTTYTTDLKSVPVGFVMNVTPQIGEQESVLLNIRPSISRIIGTVADPNPALKAAGITSSIPVIRTREMESVIRIDNGNIAVMGGLMEDVQNNTDAAVPGLGKLPGIGNFFQQRDDTRTKTELVIFLRPIVIKEASVNGDYRHLRNQLPDRDFFNRPDTREAALQPSGSQEK